MGKGRGFGFHEASFPPQRRFLGTETPLPSSISVSPRCPPAANCFEFERAMEERFSFILAWTATPGWRFPTRQTVHRPTTGCSITAVQRCRGARFNQTTPKGRCRFLRKPRNQTVSSFTFAAARDPNSNGAPILWNGPSRRSGSIGRTRTPKTAGSAPTPLPDAISNRCCAIRTSWRGWAKEFASADWRE